MAWSGAYRGRRVRGGLGRGALARAALCALLALSCTGLCGCKDTDFFKQIVLVPFDAPPDPNDVITYNSPDAEMESTNYPALELDDDTGETSAWQYVAVYGSEPNSDLTTRHSVYDPFPRFPGIEASDAVRLVASDDESALDSEVTGDAAPVEAESRTEKPADDSEASEQGASGDDESEADEQQAAEGAGAGQSTQQSASEGAGAGDSSGQSGAGDSGDGGEGDGADDQQSGTGGDGGWEEVPGEGAGEGSGGEAEGPGAGEATGDGTGGSSGDGDGQSARESGGYGGDDITYDPGNKLLDVPAAEHVAATGQAAVLAQAIGGKGAVVAMDEATFYGQDADGDDATWASSFSAVFGDELPDGFEDGALLWSGEGTSPSQLKDVSALIAAVAGSDGTGGVVLFNGEYGGQKDLFSSQQLEAFRDAGVKLLPVSFATPQGALDAATAIGEALAESDSIAEDAEANAARYADACRSIVAAAASAHGGGLATGGESTETFGSMGGLSLGTRRTDIYGAVATDFETGIAFNGNESCVDLDVSGGLLFADAGYMGSPLSFYMQAAGVVNKPALVTAVLRETGKTMPLIGVVSHYSKTDFSGYSPQGPFSRSFDYMDGDRSFIPAVECFFGLEVDSGMEISEGISEYGFGSDEYPYLVVCASEAGTAAQAKHIVLASAQAEDTPYYAYPSSFGSRCQVLRGERWQRSVIGEQHGHMGSAFLDTGVSMDDSVRENPCGLLGNWARGSAESVLEAAWVAELYSKKPANSYYEPINDMGAFKADVGGTECASAQETVQAFYENIYRCPASQGAWSYGDVVTDDLSGLE